MGSARLVVVTATLVFALLVPKLTLAAQKVQAFEDR